MLTLHPQEYLRRLTNQIPDAGSHAVRYYGAHVNRLRSTYRDEEGDVKAHAHETAPRPSSGRSNREDEIPRGLRRCRGVSHDAVAGMAVHIADVETLKPILPLEPWPEGLDRRWTAADAERFLAAARRFAKETDFAGFFAVHGKLYGDAVARMQEVLAKDAGFDCFFGARPGARFTIVLGMLNGPACYGPRLVRDSGEADLCCVLGVWAVDGKGRPRFDIGMLGTVAHEFCHSYVNWVVSAHLAARAGHRSRNAGRQGDRGTGSPGAIGGSSNTRRSASSSAIPPWSGPSFTPGGPRSIREFLSSRLARSRDRREGM